MNAMTPYWILVKREIWEHRSFWIVPIVIGCLAILGTLYGSGALIVAAHQGMVSINGNISMTLVDRVRAARAFILGSAGIFNVAMLLMVWFYLMDSLYADRKDRSILFWKSLPLSDSRLVLSKLFTGMVTAPALMLLIVIIAEIIIGILFVIAAGIAGINLLSVALQPGTIILAWITLAFALIVQSIWLLPFYGWFLLCSAWAKKLVLAWAVLIPLGFMAAEGIIFHTGYIAHAIFGHIGRMFTMLMSGRYSINNVSIGPSIDINNGHEPLTSASALMTLGSVGRIFALPEMWIGVGIGIIFILGAIWLRHNRSEI
ncbi:MAG: hypothetical protein ACRER0_00725 [Gammaproteobacteria bacterium]